MSKTGKIKGGRFVNYWRCGWTSYCI